MTASDSREQQQAPPPVPPWYRRLWYRLPSRQQRWYQPPWQDYEPLRGRPAHRRRWRPRPVEIVGLVVGLVIGSAGMVAIAAHDKVGATVAGGNATQTVAGGSQPDPTALDREWAAYSAQSTCADWAGGDGVSAVRMNSSQIAWFFSDTFLGPASPTEGFSRSIGLLHNSVVIQTVAGQHSNLVTVTGGQGDDCLGVSHPAKRPLSVVASPEAPGGPGGRYWEEDGLLIGGTIVKFYDRYLPGNVPYTPTGTVLAAFPVKQLEADGHRLAAGAAVKPKITPLPSYTPAGGTSPLVWGAAVMRSGSLVYVYGTQTPDTTLPARTLYLARVPASELTRFDDWQFYDDGEWVSSQEQAQPLEPQGGLTVSSGFSVLKVGQRYWLIQADPLAGSQDIDAYPGSAPWGPFDSSAGILLYRDPDIGLDAAQDFRIMYEARAELALSTSRTLVISYNVNTLGVSTGCMPMSWFTNTITQPRFVTIPLSVLADASGAGSASSSGGRGVAKSGSEAYPHIADKSPGQWFDEWDYAGGCPPVPGLTTVQAVPGSTGVRLSWAAGGLGVSYRVSLLAPGADAFQQKAITSGNSITLSGLPPGLYQAEVVPVNYRQDAGSGAQVAFIVP
jgi:hypothetical protein